MATPHDLYVRFLVTKGIDDIKVVAEKFTELSLICPSQAIFDIQFNLVHKSVPKSIMLQIEKQQYEGDFLKWMGVLELKEIWKAEKHYLDIEQKRRFTVLYGVHDDPHLRLCLNALLIKNVKDKDVAELANLKFSSMLKEEHIKLYREYFFNPQRMTRKDWKAYLRGCSGKELHIYFTALTDPIETLKTELELPTDVNVAEPLQFLLMKSYQKAKLYLEHSTKEANHEARAWITQVINLSEKYEKYRVADKTDFAKQLQMQFDFVDNDFVTPDDLNIAELVAQKPES